MTMIFIGMKPMEKKLVVRITDSQAKWLTKELAQKNTTKSQAVRAALNQYLIEKTHLDETSRMTDNQNKKDIKNKKSL